MPARTLQGFDWGRPDRTPDVMNRAEFEQRAWDLVAEQQRRVETWVPMIYEMRQMQLRRKRDWEAWTMNTKYQQALGLEKARSAGQMERLRFEWEQRGELAAQKQAAETAKQALRPAEIEFLGGLFPDMDLTGMTRDAINDMRPFLMAQRTKLKGDKAAALVDARRDELKEKYPDYAIAFDLAVTPEEVTDIIIKAVEAERAAVKATPAEARAERYVELAEQRETRMAEAATAKALQTDYLLVAQEIRAMRKEGAPVGLTQSDYATLRGYGYTDAQIIAFDFPEIKRQASPKQMEDALDETGDDAAAAWVLLRQDGFVPPNVAAR